MIKTEKATRKILCDNCNDIDDPLLYHLSISNDAARRIYSPKDIYLCEKCIKELQTSIMQREKIKKEPEFPPCHNLNNLGMRKGVTKPPCNGHSCEKCIKKY